MYDAFTLSDFLRRSGEVLERLAAEDIVLRRRDEDDALLTTARRQDVLRDTVRVLTAMAVNDHPPQSWVHLLPDVDAFGAELAAAASAWAELGVIEPLERVMGRARRSVRRGPLVISWQRPVAVPVNLRDAPLSGVVELPEHIRWSGSRRSYDASRPADLKRLYEQVLREGTEEDVERFIDLDTLRSTWDDLVLPRHVRLAWAERLRGHP